MSSTAFGSGFSGGRTSSFAAADFLGRMIAGMTHQERLDQVQVLAKPIHHPWNQHPLRLGLHPRTVSGSW
jgi:hypothetical protein